jgi:hypothetical protein
MTPDKYQEAWKAEAARMQVTIDADSLAKEVQRFERDFQSTIFWRDVREAGVSLVMIPIWLAMGAWLALPWTWYLMLPTLVWVAGFLVVDRRRHPQRASEPGEPLLFYVKESLAQVEHQIWLLRNVLWWYLLPFAIPMMAFFLQVAWGSSAGWWGFTLFAGLMGLSVLVIYWGVYRLNQRAVRAHLEPRRQDLLKLVSHLEQETSGEESSDVVDLVSALAGSSGTGGLSSSWAENWNLLVPSWREAAMVVVPTLVGGLLGAWYPLPEMGPVFFQSVVAAVIPFELALVWVWLRFRKRQKRLAAAEDGPTAGVDGRSSTIKAPARLPGAPAMLILVLTVVISILAILALYRFVSEAKRGNGIDVQDGQDVGLRVWWVADESV